MLDLVLSGPTGFEILAALKKKRPGQAVIILSARGEENDRVRGLVGGADDYVVKPFSMKELLARVDAVLRRTCERNAPANEKRFSGGTVDFRDHMLRFDDGRVETLSEREAQLLRYLMDAGGRIVGRDEILRQLWQLDPARTDTRTLDMHVMHLRAKLGDKEQRMLATVRGKGWIYQDGGAA
jgi:DNA-binding response OmpR family regulator